MFWVQISELICFFTKKQNSCYFEEIPSVQNRFGNGWEIIFNKCSQSDNKICCLATNVEKSGFFSFDRRDTIFRGFVLQYYPKTLPKYLTCICNLTLQILGTSYGNNEFPTYFEPKI